MVVGTAVSVVKVRVLKWNENLKNIKESHGLFMVRFKKSTNSTRNNSSEQDCYRFSVFESIHLSTPDTTDWLVSNAIQGCFMSLVDTRTSSRLSTAISAYLFRYFRLNIVVDLPVSMSTNNYSIPRFRTREDWEGKESSPRCECVTGELGIQEVKTIRGMLMFVLKEPIVLWVRPLVRCEPTGLYQVQELLDYGNELDHDACSIC